jgi:pyridoxal phosphate phosphatase PHOSPHO2
LFEEIVTNPAEWDSSGLLKLRRRIDPSGPQHACKVGCNPNMCKGNLGVSQISFSIHLPFIAGEELDAFLERHKTVFDRIIYIGDGSNDYCPVLRLRRFAEITNYPIWHIE